MHSAVECRPITLIELETLGSEFSLEFSGEVEMQDTSIAWVGAFQAGVLVGCIGLFSGWRMSPLQCTGSPFAIVGWYVTPACRKAGVGTALVEYAEAQLVNAHRDWWLAARYPEFWLKRGWVDTGKRGPKGEWEMTKYVERV